MRHFSRWLIAIAAAAVAVTCAPNHPPPTLVCSDCEAACHLCSGLSCLAADAGYADSRCGAYVCDSDAGCFTSCAGPAECQPDAFCDAGQCYAFHALGSLCTWGGECKGGHCVDGVCCDSACGEACDRCNLSGLEGTCSPAPLGTPGAPTCSPFACNGADAGCPSTCAVDQGCASGFFCNSAACVPVLTLGTACGRNAMCASGNCVDGFCCDTACAGACDACNVPTKEGTCSPAPARSAGSPTCAPYACGGSSTACPTSCTTDTECDTSHACGDGGVCVPSSANGAACTRAGECQSGFCVDGVCCSSACTGACNACNLAGSTGTCGVASAGAPGRPSCAPYVCGGAATSCPSSCTTNAQCAVGQACNGSACQVDGDKDGTADAVDCAPADATKWTNRACFKDADGDGFFAKTSTPTCSGAACPAGTQATAGTDCNDADAGVYQLVTCFGGLDADNDGFHAGAGASTCTGAQCPAGTSSLKDCYDLNANAKPGQFLTYAVSRGDGSFDYDCDGLETKDVFWDCSTSYAGTAACSAVPYSGNRGYVGASPACGVLGTWRTCAVWGNATCNTVMFQYGACGAGCFPADGGSYSVENVPLAMKCR